MVVRVSNPYPFVVLAPEPTVRTGIIVEIYDGDDPNTLLEVLDDTWARTWNDPLSGSGSVSFTVSGRNPKLVADPTLLTYGHVVRFRLDGIVRFAFQVEKIDRSQVAESDIKPITVAGRGVLSKLEEADAYPQVDGNPVRGFAGIPPGHLMRVLLEEAQARGAIPGVNWTFTDTLDSQNAPWAESLDQTERAGTDLLRIAERIGATAGDVYMTPGLELRMVNTRGVDRTLQTVDTGPVVLEPGRNILELERDESGAIRNVLLIETPAGFVERVDGDSVSLYGRREAFLSLGNVSDTTAVDRAAEAVFAKSANPAARIAIKVSDVEGHRPYVDFSPGDWVKAPDADGELTKYRIRAITVSETAEGTPIFIPELATITEELENRLERWLASMSRGTLGGVAADVSEPLGGPSEETTEAITTGVDSGVSTHIATTTHATELDDLTDVDLTTTPPNDGDGIFYDAGSGLWLPDSVGASSGPAIPGWVTHLAEADDSPDIDEPFAGSALAGAWTVVDPGPATAYTRTVKRGVLSVGIQNAVGDCAAIVQALPAFTTGFRIETAMRAMSYNGNYLMAGPVASAGTDTTDPVVWVMNFNHRHSYIDNKDLRSGTFDNISTDHNATDHNAPGGALAWHSPLLYYRLEYDTTSGFRQGFSPDGITWMDTPTFVANPLGAAPTHFGLGQSSWGSDLKVVTWEYVHLYIDP